MTHSAESDNVIVIWSKSQSKSSSLYELMQRITRKETETLISKLVLLSQEEFASCSNKSVIIWTQGRTGGRRIQNETKNRKLGKLFAASL